MPVKYPDDERAHLTFREKEIAARQLIEVCKTIITQDQGNAPACRECLAGTLICAFVMALEDVRKGNHLGEMMGVAKIISQSGPLLKAEMEKLAEVSIDKAMSSPNGIEAIMTIIMAAGE